MSYLGLSPDYPDEYFTTPYVDNKKMGFPIEKTGAEQYDLIEQQVQPTLSTIQQAPKEGIRLALVAIVAYLILGA